VEVKSIITLTERAIVFISIVLDGLGKFIPAGANIGKKRKLEDAS
jgi:hypothetical protein